MTEHRLNLSKLAESMRNGAHSIFSASGSHLWFNCAGGLLPNLLAKDVSGYEAAEGTVAHGVGEEWLRTGVKPRHLIGRVVTVDGHDITIDEVMLTYVQEYVDWCAWLHGQHYVETKVYYSQLTPIPEQGGTADHAVASYQKLIVTDLKYGKGHQVWAKDNTQAILYALGFFYLYDWLWDFQTIEIRICQPRMQHFDIWMVSREELLSWADRIRDRAHAAWSLDAPRTPGEKQCLFCKVKASCGAHFAWQVEATSGAWSDESTPVTAEQVAALKDDIEFEKIWKLHDVYSLTTDEMVRLYKFRGMFEAWWKALHNQLNIRAAQGESITGMKMVEARTRRVIKDRDETLRVLTEELPEEHRLSREELVEESFASPADIEKLLRKHGYTKAEVEKVLAPLVRKPTGKPTLVSEADRRDAIVDLTEIAFSDLDLETETEET